MELLAGWIFLAALVGVWASNRGRSGVAWFLLAVLLSPLLAGLALAVSKRPVAVDPAAPTPETHVKCPECAELVKREARICKHCSCRLVPQ